MNASLPSPPRQAPPRRLLALLVLLVLLGARGSQAGRSELWVIVNAQNPVTRLTAADLRPIFQTTKYKWDDGTRVEPANLPEKSPQRQLFDKALFGFDPDTVAKYWIDRKVRGEARPPKRLPTPGAVLSFVASTPGAIGYVPAEGPRPSGVKIVARLVGEELRPP